MRTSRLNGAVSRAEGRREVGRAQARVVRDRLQVLVGPLAHPLQRGEHRVVGRRLAQRDPRVGPGQVQRDPVEVARPLRERVEHRARLVVAGGARVLVGRPLDDLDAVTSSTPIGVRSREPDMTRGFSQRRNASVMRPPAIPSRSPGLKSIKGSDPFKSAVKPGPFGAAHIGPDCRVPPGNGASRTGWSPQEIWTASRSRTALIDAPAVRVRLRRRLLRPVARRRW